jgi:mannosyltransferase OCH1-like enzyme
MENIHLRSGIPEIIHQVWEGKTSPISELALQLAETWKKHHSGWQYELWNKERMESFVMENFPEMEKIYFGYKYDVQRWDVIRYLILYKIGGLYVDFDFECLNVFDDFIKDEKKCYFSMEPNEHCLAFNREIYFNNALMITPPNHVFFQNIIEHLCSASVSYTSNKFQDVMISTGPLMLTDLYDNFEEKQLIELFPPELVSPWSKREVLLYRNNMIDESVLDKKLNDAIAIHYFLGSWI